MNTAATKERIHEISPRFEARFAGCLYLLIILGGLFAPFAIAPSGMMIGEAALPTTAKILAEKPLYVIGGVAQLLVYTCDIGVALIFYELLKPVHRNLALAATFFRLVFVAVASANMLNHFAPVILLSGGNYLSAFSPTSCSCSCGGMGYVLSVTDRGRHRPCVTDRVGLVCSTLCPGSG